MRHDMEAKEIAYLLLQHKYLCMILGKEDYTEEEALAQSHKVFPTNWYFTDTDRKIKLIARAIKEKRNLREICEADQS